MVAKETGTPVCAWRFMMGSEGEFDSVLSCGVFGLGDRGEGDGEEDWGSRRCPDCISSLICTMAKWMIMVMRIRTLNSLKGGHVFAIDSSISRACVGTFKA